jgi:hypothetical protein
VPPGDEGGDERHQEERGYRDDSDDTELDYDFQVLIVEDVIGIRGQVGSAALAEPRRLVEKSLDLWVVVYPGLHGGVIRAGSEEAREGPDHTWGRHEDSSHREWRHAQRYQALTCRQQNHEQ